ncbi:MAG: hypothetical protein LBQ65_10325 [Tannerellaceae bacterium]|jgi:hypothetical protein|nr:hypothetical protein [Tannerellaceae bacterium]
MKRDVICLLLFMGICQLSSCVDSGYGWDNINKEGAFSHENGINVQIGNFDTIRFRTVEVANPIDIEYVKDVDNLFSEEMYDYFVFNNKGREEPLGAILFEGDFVARISNVADKMFSDFELSTSILNAKGEDTGISIANQTFKANAEQAQFFVVNVAKEDVPKLKEAQSLKLTFAFQSRKVEREDYVLIENINLKLSGGFKIGLE